MGANEESPQLFIGRVLFQQLFQPGNGFLDPRLAAAAQLAVDDAPVQAVPGALEVTIAIDQELVDLLVFKLLGRIRVPHRVQLQQLLVDFTVVIFFIVYIGHIANVILLDEFFVDKGVDLGLLQPE